MNSVDDELTYLSDLQSQEAELRRLNDELDSKLEKAVVSGSRPIPPTDRLLIRQSTNLGSQLSKSGSSKKIDSSPAGNSIPATTDTDVDWTRAPSKGRFQEADACAAVATKNNKKTPDIPQDPSCAASDGSISCGSEDDLPRTKAASGYDKVQKAQNKVLRAQLKDALRLKKQAEDELAAVRRKQKEDETERKRLAKAVNEAKVAADQRKTRDEQHKAIVLELKQELNQARRDLTAAKKGARASESEHKRREIRLSRALEECDKFKATLARATSDTRDVDVSARKERDKLLAQVRTLERQRAELLVAFKKQLKLIDILKRQKLHAEAAKLLQFTEDEFMKVLNWGTEK